MKYNINKNQDSFPVQAFSATFLFYISTLLVNANTIQNFADFCVDLDPREVFFREKNFSEPQTTCPFFIKSNSTEVEIDNTVQLTLTSNELHKFKGFILQSRYHDMLVGIFSEDPNITLYDCYEYGLKITDIEIENYLGYEGKVGKKNTVLYNGDELIDSYSLIWEAPDYIVGDVNLYFTVYRDNHMYWKFQTTAKSFVTVTYTHRLYLEDDKYSKFHKKS
ncbi:uncharacterized protein LOC142320599 [Lycorma delicatula]|uniref:uncharacterized protein LOC142320599 n=1 Tax=Lycorma delicatula TaxID=130591 RepID=UPI003F511B95